MREPVLVALWVAIGTAVGAGMSWGWRLELLPDNTFWLGFAGIGVLTGLVVRSRWAYIAVPVAVYLGYAGGIAAWSLFMWSDNAWQRHEVYKGFFVLAVTAPVVCGMIALCAGIGEMARWYAGPPARRLIRRIRS